MRAMKHLVGLVLAATGSSAAAEQNFDVLPKLRDCIGYHAVNLEPYTDDMWSLATLIVKSLCVQEFNEFVGPVSLDDADMPSAFEERFIREAGIIIGDARLNRNGLNLYDHGQLKP